MLYYITLYYTKARESEGFESGSAWLRISVPLGGRLTESCPSYSTHAKLLLPGAAAEIA